jgi:hypothetical protein
MAGKSRIVADMEGTVCDFASQHHSLDISILLASVQYSSLSVREGSCPGGCIACPKLSQDVELCR